MISDPQACRLDRDLIARASKITVASMPSDHPLADAIHSLTGMLSRKRDHGVEGIALSDRARQELETLPQKLAEFVQPAGEELRAENPGQSGPTVQALASVPVQKSEVSSPPLDTAALLAPITGGSVMPAQLPGTHQTPPQPSTAAAAGVSASSDPGGAASELSEKERREALNSVFRSVKESDIPARLTTLRETVVFAAGDPMAQIAFVGEAPGAEEEKLRKPFVGPAGKKLDQIIGAMGLSRDSVYISNIVKFRPATGDPRFQGSRNRKPTPEEMEACLQFIRREMEIIRPKVIVALGATAAEGLLEIGGSVGSMREKWHDFDGIPVRVTYHPSYVLRQEGEGGDKGKRAKRLVWLDMLAAMERLGLSISEKQRNYFA